MSDTRIALIRYANDEFVIDYGTTAQQQGEQLLIETHYDLPTTLTPGQNVVVRVVGPGTVAVLTSFTPSAKPEPGMVRLTPIDPAFASQFVTETLSP